MRKLLLLLFLISGWLMGCRPAGDGGERVEEPEAVQFTIGDTLKTYLPNWTAYYTTQVEAFDPAGYRLVDSLQKDTLYSRSYDPQQLGNFLDLYQDYLVYSPDSSRVLDLYSYRYVFEEQEDGPTQVMKDVDVEAALVNLEKEERKRLLFLGAAGFVEDGAWIDNKRVIITGGMIVPENPEMMQLKAWVINLETRWMYTYEYPEYIDRSDVNYVQEVIFRDLTIL